MDTVLSPLRAASDDIVLQIPVYLPIGGYPSQYIIHSRGNLSVTVEMKEIEMAVMEELIHH